MWKEIRPCDTEEIYRHCRLMRDQFPATYSRSLCTADTLTDQIEQQQLKAFVYSEDGLYIGFGLDFSQRQQVYFLSGLTFTGDDPLEACEMLIAKIVSAVPRSAVVVATRPAVDPPIKAYKLLSWLEDAAIAYNQRYPDAYVELVFQASSGDERWEIRT